MGDQSQLRRDAESKPDRADRRGGLKQAYARRQLLDRADHRRAGKAQRDIHQKDGGSDLDYARVDPPAEALRIVLAAKNRNRVSDQHGDRGGFHAARRRAGRAADQHQYDEDRLTDSRHGGQIERIEARGTGRDRLEQRPKDPFAERELSEIIQKEDDRGHRDQNRGGDQYHLALHTVALEAEFIRHDVLPRQKADTAHDDQKHQDDIDQRMGRIIGHRREFLSGSSHQVKAGVAESGDRMEHRHPNSPRAVVDDKNRHHDHRADQLDESSALEDELRESDDTANVRRGDRVLHRAPLAERQSLTHQHHRGRHHRDHAQSSDLDQSQDDRLTEARPIGRGVLHDQPRHTDRGGRGEQRLIKRRERSALRREGQHKDQSP